MIHNFQALIQGLSAVFEFFRDFFAMLPLVIQVLIYFSFSGVLFIALLHMIRTR